MEQVGSRTSSWLNMFRRVLLGRLPLLVSAAAVCTLRPRTIESAPTQQEVEAYDMMRRLTFMPKATELRLPLATQPIPRLVVIYGRRMMTSRDFLEKLQKGTQNSHKLGYELTKLFANSQEDIAALASAFHFSETDLHDRLEHQAAVFYTEGERVLPLPVNIGTEELDIWVEKCRHPSVTPKDLAQFYSHARRVIKGEDSYMLISVDSSPEELSALKAYSVVQVHVPLIEVGTQVATSLGLQKGVYVCRPYSRLDGEKDVTKMGMLQYFKCPINVADHVAFQQWLVTVRHPTIGYLGDLDKVYPHLVRLHSGSRRCLLIFTSQLNHHSRRYQQLLDDLLKLQREHPDVVIAIVPSDLVASKMGVIRDKKLRRMHIPEARFVDYNRMIGTSVGADGKFEEVDCTQNQGKCSDLSDTHYSRKTAYKGETMDYTQLKSFLQDSLSGTSQQYYEVKPLPLRNAKKLNAGNFREEVLESKEDVLLEIYGKYCPGCRAFAPKFDVLAGELKKTAGLKVVKVCSDFNHIPELSDKKPFTPIFWYYRAGAKDAPIKYEGANKVDDLRAFVAQHSSPPS